MVRDGYAIHAQKAYWSLNHFARNTLSAPTDSRASAPNAIGRPPSPSVYNPGKGFEVGYDYNEKVLI